MISVIMPCFNQAQWMQNAIDSVKAQTHKDHEIICIIDGAIDNSKEIAEKNKCIVVDFEKNMGVAYAMNAGLAIAKGEYICVLSQDDMLDETYFERSVGYDITSSDIEYFGGEERYVKIPAVWNDIYKNNQIHGSSVFKKHGKWDEKAEHYCDWDMWAQLHARGYKLNYIQEPLLRVRIHENQISNKVRSDLDEYVRRKIFV